MLSKRRCPRTGVVNFYFDEDPFMSVGSVVPAEGARFFWRFYPDPFARGGLTTDLKSAERQVMALGRLAERTASPARTAA